MNTPYIKTITRTHCLSCGTPLSNVSLRFPRLAICNDFRMPQDGQSTTSDLAMACCDRCDLVQLSEYPSVVAMRPRHSWINYKEPSGHLDELADLIEKKVFVSSACGLGPFDAPLLSRLSQKGFLATELNLASPAGDGFFPYLESIQENLATNKLLQECANKPLQNLIICRYLLEHCTNPLGVLSNLRLIMPLDGYMLIEVPDNSKFLSSLDYSFIWEEHIIYFNQSSLLNLVERAGYEVIEFMRVPGNLEDALIVILKAGNDDVKREKPYHESADSKLFLDFVNQFALSRERIREKLQTVCGKGKQVALFGAGHQAAMFVNALGLESLIKVVADDAVEKQGYFLPGTKLPIVSSEQLLADPEIQMCLTVVNPSLEHMITQKLQTLIDRNACIRSIYPASPTALIPYAKCN